MSKTKSSPTATLVEAHHALLKDLADLERFAQSSGESQPADVVACLETVRAHLGKHFRFEEQNGYMQAVLVRAPQQERQVQRLREDHDALWQTPAALMWQAKDASALGEEYRQQVRAWIDQVRDHEKRENVLVEDTFNTDIAAED